MTKRGMIAVALGMSAMFIAGGAYDHAVAPVSRGLIDCEADGVKISDIDFVHPYTANQQDLGHAIQWSVCNLADEGGGAITHTASEGTK